MTRAPEDGSGLLSRLAEGEAGAAEDVFRAYGGLVWSLALRFCRSRDDAEDAVQEIFTDLWGSAHRYRSRCATESVFVTMIARRRLIDRLRRERRRAEIEPRTIGPEAERHHAGDGGERGWDAEQAARAIRQLSAEQQRVLEMSIVQGLTQREIAEATGAPLGTVKTHMRRGFMRLREMMATQDAGISSGTHR